MTSTKSGSDLDRQAYHDLINKGLLIVEPLVRSGLELNPLVIRLGRCYIPGDLAQNKHKHWRRKASSASTFPGRPFGRWRFTG